MIRITRRSALKRLAAGTALLAGFGTQSHAADVSRAVRFELYRSGRQFRWRLRSGNNRIMATSGESYVSKAGCRSAIETIQVEVASAAIEDLA